MLIVGFACWITDCCVVFVLTWCLLVVGALVGRFVASFAGLVCLDCGLIVLFVLIVVFDNI